MPITPEIKTEIVKIRYPKLSSQTIHKIMKVEGRLATKEREYSIMGNVVAEMYYVNIPSGWKIEIKIHLPGGGTCYILRKSTKIVLML